MTFLKIVNYRVTNKNQSLNCFSLISYLFGAGPFSVVSLSILLESEQRFSMSSRAQTRHKTEIQNDAFPVLTGQPTDSLLELTSHLMTNSSDIFIAHQWSPQFPRLDAKHTWSIHGLHPITRADGTDTLTIPATYKQMSNHTIVFTAHLNSIDPYIKITTVVSRVAHCPFTKQLSHFRRTALLKLRSIRNVYEDIHTDHSLSNTN